MRDLKHTNKTIQKYLSTFAEPDIQHTNIPHIANIESVLVLPIFDEPIENLNRFLQINSKKKIAMVWVFNCPNNALADEQQRTQTLMQHFLKVLNAQVLAQIQPHSTSMYVAELSEFHQLYIIDRCTEGHEIPSKQGVGLARKLGMDFGLKLINAQNRSLVWLHSTDADVIRPPNYFDIPAPEMHTSAMIYPFEHQAEQGYEQAMFLYDLSLRYYVDQLKWAGSPYAFHTIGSLITVAPLAYSQVRGIPKRSGAEDFYLLNKLAKVGTVKTLESPMIKIAGRPSHRVPFGTGPALVKLKEMESSHSNYTFYQPNIFKALKCLLTIVSEAEQTIASAEILFTSLRDTMPKQKAETVIKALKALKIEKQFENLSQQRTKAQFIKSFHTWFDAFVTLRFIHIMRDLDYPSVNVATLKHYFERNGAEFESYKRLTSLGI